MVGESFDCESLSGKVVERFEEGSRYVDNFRVQNESRFFGTSRAKNCTTGARVLPRVSKFKLCNLATPNLGP